MEKGLKSDLGVAEAKKNGLKTKCAGLGASTVTKVSATNIEGVLKHGSVFDECSNMLRTYKNLLDSDAEHIRSLGMYFFDVDHGMADTTRKTLYISGGM